MSEKNQPNHQQAEERRTQKLTSELRRLQNLQEHQILIPRILNIMTIRLREIPNITSHIVKSRSSIRRRKQRRPTLALNKERPLIARRVPMDLAHATRMNSHNRRGEIAGYWEGERVDNLDGAAGYLVGALFGEVVGVALGAGDETG